MDFGKLNNIDTVDFRLPPTPEATQNYLNSLMPRQAPLQLYFGCTGWSMKEWVGRYYPKGTKSAQYLQEYSKQFNTIELNSTHYRIPDAETIIRWIAQSQEGFSFAPKIPQVISHSRDLGLSGNYIEAFCEAIQPLGRRLGLSFMQLPPYFGPEQMPLLERFLERFPTQSIPLSIELRQEAWFGEKSLLEQWVGILRQYGVGTTMSDVAGRRDVLHLQLSTPTAMIRFVGNNLHQSDFDRIDEWVLRLSEWSKQGLQRVYFFLHEPDNLLAPDIAHYFVQKVNELMGLQLSPPQNYGDQQLSLF